MIQGLQPTALLAFAQLRWGLGVQWNGSKKRNRAWAGCYLPGLPRAASANSLLWTGTLAACEWPFRGGKGACACEGRSSPLPRGTRAHSHQSHCTSPIHLWLFLFTFFLGEGQVSHCQRAIILHEETREINCCWEWPVQSCWASPNPLDSGQRISKIDFSSIYLSTYPFIILCCIQALCPAPWSKMKE